MARAAATLAWMACLVVSARCAGDHHGASSEVTACSATGADPGSRPARSVTTCSKSSTAVWSSGSSSSSLPTSSLPTASLPTVPGPLCRNSSPAVHRSMVVTRYWAAVPIRRTAGAEFRSPPRCSAVRTASAVSPQPSACNVARTSARLRAGSSSATSAKPRTAPTSSSIPISTSTTQRRNVPGRTPGGSALASDNCPSNSSATSEICTSWLRSRRAVPSSSGSSSRSRATEMAARAVARSAVTVLRSRAAGSSYNSVHISSVTQIADNATAARITGSERSGGSRNSTKKYACQHNRP